MPRSQFWSGCACQCRHNTTSNPRGMRRKWARQRDRLVGTGENCHAPVRDGRPCRRSRRNEKREGSHAFEDIELDRRSGIGRDGEPGQRDSSRRHHARRQQQIHHAGRQPGAAQRQPVRQRIGRSVADDVVAVRLLVQRRRRQADRAQSARQRHRHPRRRNSAAQARRRGENGARSDDEDRRRSRAGPRRAGEPSADAPHPHRRLRHHHVGRDRHDARRQDRPRQSRRRRGPAGHQPRLAQSRHRALPHHLRADGFQSSRNLRHCERSEGNPALRRRTGLLRRFAPRNDGLTASPTHAAATARWRGCRSPSRGRSAW